MPRRVHALFFVLALLLWSIALLVPVPRDAASQVLGGEGGMHIFGKTLHVAAYAFLTVVGLALPLTRRQRLGVVVMLSVHAFLSEFFQQFVDRGASWRDVGLDHVGIGIGILISRFWFRVSL